MSDTTILYFRENPVLLPQCCIETLESSRNREGSEGAPEKSTSSQPLSNTASHVVRCLRGRASITALPRIHRAGHPKKVHIPKLSRSAGRSQERRCKNNGCRDTGNVSWILLPRLFRHAIRMLFSIQSGDQMLCIVDPFVAALRAVHQRTLSEHVCITVSKRFSCLSNFGWQAFSCLPHHKGQSRLTRRNSLALRPTALAVCRVLAICGRASRMTGVFKKTDSGFRQTRDS